MENILGANVSNLYLNIVQEIGTILFAEFPTTILYIDTDQNLVIKEWVDCSDDGLTDRFFYYRTTKLNVARFLKNKQSHLDLIRNSKYRVVYFQDVNSNNLSHLTILSATKIPNDYLPSSNFTLSNKDIVDFEKINKFLDIDNINLNIDVSQRVKKVKTAFLPFKIGSFDYTFSLTGKLADFHKAETPIMSDTNNKVHSLLKSSSTFLEGLRITPRIYSGAAMAGSFELNFKIELEETRNSFTKSTEDIKIFYSKFLKYLFEKLPKEPDNVIKNAEEASEDLKTLFSEVKELYSNRNIPIDEESSKQKIIDLITYSVDAIKDIEYKGFDRIEVKNKLPNGDKLPLGLIGTNYYDSVSKKVFKPIGNDRVIDKGSVQESPEDLIKKYTKIDVSSLNTDELPIEIQKSFKRLLSNLEIDRSTTKYFESPNYCIANYPFFQMFDELQNEITKLLNGIFKKRGKEESLVSQEYGTFEIDERSSLYSAITGFTYPYYLDKKREYVAGIIPFAYQNYFAIIIAKENKYYQDWVGLRNEILSDRSNNFNTEEIAELNISPEKTKKWLKDLLTEMNKVNGLIHFINGYIFGNVVTDFQNKHFENNNVGINQMNQQGTKIKDLKKLKFFSKPKDADKAKSKYERLKKYKKQRNTIFILDPIEAFHKSYNNSKIKDLIDTDCYDVINVRHGLEYPIGVGFSLYALPFLLENNNWKIIQDKAIEGLKKIINNNDFTLDRFGWISIEESEIKNPIIKNPIIKNHKIKN